MKALLPFCFCGASGFTCLERERERERDRERERQRERDRERERESLPIDTTRLLIEYWKET